MSKLRRHRGPVESNVIGVEVGNERLRKVAAGRWTTVDTRSGGDQFLDVLRRVPVMQEWADFVTKTMGPVVPV